MEGHSYIPPEAQSFKNPGWEFLNPKDKVPDVPHVDKNKHDQIISLNDIARYIGDHKVETKIVEKKPEILFRKPKDRVAKHEALHAVPAHVRGAGVKSVTIVPGEGYLGLTVLDRHDPVAALAPHVKGMDGTAWDRRIVELAGHDIKSNSHTAEHIANKHEDAVDAVAVLLEDKKTITGMEVAYAVDEVKKAKENPIFDASIIITKPTGDKVEFRKENVQNGEVMIPGMYFDLPSNPLTANALKPKTA